jgi:hypothetical protein
MNMEYKLIISPWKNEFIETIKNTKKELIISSPFVDSRGVQILKDAVSLKSSVTLSLITNITTKNLITGFTEPSALLELYEYFNDVKISSLGRLHAKVYIIDEKIGIITSANLTGGGLMGNFEYGILLKNKEVVASIKSDMLEYYSFGNIFDRDTIEKIRKEVEIIREKRVLKEKLPKSSELEELLKNKEENIETEILKNRIKGGKTINSIFAETILYILKKKGPLSTKEMHPLIQAIHPEICDDSIDRVINGQHFGKKWKHLVRDAQQFLKKKGLIYLKNGKWQLSD